MAFQHPHSGPQDPPFLRKEAPFLRNQDHSRNNANPVRNFTQPQNISGNLGHPPLKIDVPPLREQYPQHYQYQGHPPQMHPFRPNYTSQGSVNMYGGREMNTSPNNSAVIYPGELAQQPPELPPKPHSGLLQQQPHAHQHQQLQMNHQQQPQQQHMYPPPQMHHMNYAPQEPQASEPYYRPPPVPARPSQQHTSNTPPMQPREPQIQDKQKTSGTIYPSGVDVSVLAQVEELSRDPTAAATRLKKLAEQLSSLPDKYEAVIQGKVRKLQEAANYAHQELTVLKLGLQSTQTDNHNLKGQLQLLAQENQVLHQQTGNVPTDFSNEETQLLIADLRKQIVDLQCEVPDPNLCESLRLMIKLMDEDRKLVEKKYTEVSDELHARDNEISRLMKEKQSTGNIIKGGQTAVEKQFDSKMEELRKQNLLLAQQLDIANQKLEVNLRRDVTEHEPGASRVELMAIVENATNFNDKLQIKVKEKEDEIVTLKKQIEASREVIVSSSLSATTLPASNENKIHEHNVGLEIQNKHLQSQVDELKKALSSNHPPRSISSSDLNLERDLTAAREKEKRLQLIIQERETQIQQLTSVPIIPQDANKEELIKSLLQEKKRLESELGNSKLEVDKLKPLEERVTVITNWLNARDTYIKQLQYDISQQKIEVGRFKMSADNLERQLTTTQRTKDDLFRSDQQCRNKIQQLEAQAASTPTINATEERYAGMVQQLQRELTDVKIEKRNVDKQFEKEREKSQRLDINLQDVSYQLANFKNQPQPPYGADYRTSHPRYTPNPTGSAQGTGSGQQGRDRGVPYPPN